MRSFQDFFKNRRETWIVGGFFLLISLAIFAQFPLQGSLPGNTDTLLAISLSNQILQKVGAFFAGHFSDPTVLYPSSGVLAYGENCYGLAALFVVFELLTQSEIVGYYLFISTIFALNGFAVTRLALSFVGDLRAAVLAGLAFTFSGFVLGNVDDPNVVFVFFPVKAFVYLIRGLRQKDPRALCIGCLFSGLQIWFGFYLFVYQSFLLVLLLLALFVIDFRSLRSFVLSRSFRS